MTTGGRHIAPDVQAEEKPSSQNPPKASANEFAFWFGLNDLGLCEAAKQKAYLVLSQNNRMVLFSDASAAEELDHTQRNRPKALDGF